MSKLVVLPPPVVPVPSDQVIVVDELVDEGYRDIPLHLVRISYTNRKRFDPEALQQLADNIAEVGILQPILMRPVTPTPEAPEIFEIVAGERRFRAAVMACLAKAPANIKHLTDKQAAVIQLLENIQRENPHPLEEAEGYQGLMHSHGYSIEQLIEHTKKSRAYIYARLKLCALALESREAFLDDKVSASTALLIARIPTPDLQKKALKEILTPQYSGEPMSYRQAATVIANRYTLNLSEAPFDTKDAKLLPDAGNCTKCPKRTGNQPEIYADARSANVCTDPDCFGEKKAANYQRLIVIANKSKTPVLEGADANVVRSNAWGGDAEFVIPETSLWSFERLMKSTGMSGSVATRLDSDQLPVPVKYLKESGGVVTPVYRRADVQLALERHGICESEEALATRLAIEETDPEVIETRRKQREREEQKRHQDEEIERKAASMTAERVALYRKLRATSQDGLPISMLRELAKLLIRDDMNYMSLPDDLIGDLYTFERDEDSACAFIDKADATTVQLLIMDLIVGEALGVSRYDISDQEEEPDLRYLAIRTAANDEGITISDAEIAATASLLVARRIDIDELETAEDVQEVIEANIEHLAAVAAHIIDKAPHHLRNVEATANALGYFYSTEGWQKSAQDASAIVEPAEQEEGSGTAPVPRKTITLKAKPQVQQGDAPGPIIKVRKNRAAQAEAGGELVAEAEPEPKLAPAAAWPFPTKKRA